MELTREMVGFAAGYATTALDFLVFVRPKRFAATIRRDPERYMQAMPFLIVSLALTTIVAFSMTLLQVDDSEQEALERFGLLGMGVAVIAIWFINTFPLAFGKLVAFVLDASIPLKSLFEAYCYCSVLFPLMIATKIIGLMPDKPGGASLVAMVLVEFTFVGVLVTAMGRFGELPVRTFRRFVALMLTCFVAVIALTTVGLGIAERNEKIAQSGEALWNSSRFDPNTIRAANETRSPGCETCWRDTVTAKSGDVISVVVYYRYARPTSPAIDTRLRLILPDWVSSTSPVGAEVWSADTPRRAQGVTTISNDGTVAFQLRFHDASWFASENDDAPTPLPNNQSGAEVLTPAGVALGRVPATICKCPGYLIVRFRCA